MAGSELEVYDLDAPKPEGLAELEHEREAWARVERQGFALWCVVVALALLMGVQALSWG